MSNINFHIDLRFDVPAGEGGSDHGVLQGYVFWTRRFPGAPQSDESLRVVFIVTNRDGVEDRPLAYVTNGNWGWVTPSEFVAAAGFLAEWLEGYLETEVVVDTEAEDALMIETANN